MIKMTKDGRVICTGKHYSQFRAVLFAVQEASCARCGTGVALSSPLEWDSSFHVHHKNGRGMGGSKRDDTLEACEGLCGKCHREEHNGSRERQIQKI
jgi:HNH endonuclease